MHINKKDATLISYFLELLETSYVELGEDRREVLRQMIAELNAACIDNRNFFHGSARSEKIHRGRKLEADGTPNINRLFEERINRPFQNTKIKDPMGLFRSDRKHIQS